MVVRDVRGVMSWAPDVMVRACREVGRTDRRTGEAVRDNRLEVGYKGSLLTNARYSNTVASCYTDTETADHVVFTMHVVLLVLVWM